MSYPPQQSDLVRMPASTLAALNRAASRAQGPMEAAALLREAGVESAESMFGAFGRWLAAGASPDVEPPELTADEFWPRLHDFFQELGWGSLRRTELHPGVVALVSPNWIEAEGADTGHPSCHFSTGLVAGLLGQVAGGEVAALEVECRASGDLRCQFLLGSPAVLQQLFERLREGSSSAQAVATLG